MAAGIEFKDRFGEVRKNGQKAWHGLGVEIEEGQTAKQVFPKIGLGWDTELLPIYSEMVNSDGVRRIELPGHRAHVRSDTGDVLGVVSKDYRQFSNAELADFVDALAGEDAASSVETAGSLHNGRRIFCLTRLPEVVKASADDEILTYVCTTNGHGGFASFNTYTTGVRVVCANTVRMSEVDLRRGCSFRHTGNLSEKVGLARHAMGIAKREVARFQEMVTALVKTDLPRGREAQRSLMERLWHKCFGDVEQLEDGATKTRLTAKRDEEILRWLDKLEEPNQNLAGIGGSLWAGYNAVSEWIDHERGRFLNVLESDARVASNLFGVSQIFKSRLLRGVMAGVK